MEIDKLAYAAGPDVYYSDDFRKVLESHLPLLRTHPNTQEISLEPQRVYKYEFDFYGLLSEYGYPPYAHWLIMRLNNLVAPTEFALDRLSILVPPLDLIDQYRQIFLTTRRISS